MTDQTATPDNSHDLYAVRLQKLENLCKEARNPFAANCEQSHSSKEAVKLYQEDATDEAQPKVSVAGRIVVFRVMGKASFIKIQDRDGQIQAYVTRDELPDGEYNTYFKKLDLGDIIGITGRLFKTKTGEYILENTHTIESLNKQIYDMTTHLLPDPQVAIPNPEYS